MSNIAKKPLRQVQNVQQLLVNDMAREQLAMVAADHMKPDRMMRIMAQSVRKTPKLAQCDPLSLLGAMMACASLGLEPGGPDGHAYLIPFENKRKGIVEVQLIIGYRGYLARAWRSGIVKSIQVGVHYSDDEHWLYRKGSNAILEHVEGPQEGEKLHAYCIVKVVNGGLEGEIVTCLPWRQILKTRDNSSGWKTAKRFGSTESNPWFTHEDAMGIKTAVRKTAQSGLLPMSSDFVNLTSADETSADFRTFAMDPVSGLADDSDGATIDGTASEQEPEDATPQKEQAKSNEPENPKAKPVEPDSEPEPEGTGPTDEEAHADLVALIKSELDDAADAGAVESVLEIYHDQIEQVSAAAKAEIEDHADKRREDLA